MSTQTSPGAVPEWDLNDRMLRALKHANLTGIGIAERLNVDRATVSRWLSGKKAPNTRTLQAWAFATGVNYVWLSTGVAPGGGSGDGLESPVQSAALAQSAERFTRNEECNASRAVALIRAAA